ncbi:hypothetical protein AcV5_007696 [Taiwanofungus camphoratus]|nr:hypothetical protein AcV5_007696 [Antrodia cinnamomea]
MSLSSFLLGAHGKGSSDKRKDVVIDKGLDDLFHSTAGTSRQAGPSTSAQLSGRNQSSKGNVSTTPTRENKRKLPDVSYRGNMKKSKLGKAKETASPSNVRRNEATEVKRHIKPAAESLVNSSDDQSEDMDTDTKEADLFRHQQKTSQKGIENAQTGSEDGSDASNDEGDPSRLIHESLSRRNMSRSNGQSTKTKYIPQDETPERRNARTIFIGNVPVEVVKGRPLQKQFKRHILSFVPTAKIESVRFRSVAFQKPTAELPTLDEPGKAKSDLKSVAKEREKEGREHDRERAASWRATKGQEEEEPGKTFLTPKEKKRIAFIKHEIHEAVDAVNAYVVFAHAPPTTGTRSANVPPPAPIMDPYEAAKLAAELCDGSVFMERTIRADRLGKSDEGDTAGMERTDPKATVFVGNLDFASKEEDLRVFFEGLVSAERGPPGENASDAKDADADDDEDGPQHNPRTMKPRTWVKRVRIIRDKDTQVGKGFAYIQFVDRVCVDEILALEQDQLKFAKRKLRVQRCKTVPGSSKVVSKFSKPPRSSSLPKTAANTRPSSASRATLPKGNPLLGTKISHLPKEDRKRVKATDPDRVARRLAKKKAKLLAEKGVKSRVERERVRKRPEDKKGSGSVLKERGKKRVRSGKALEKMNTKK